MADTKKQDAEPTEQSKPQETQETEYIAVSDQRGWCRYEDEQTAVLGALNNSHVKDGERVTIHVWECEPETQVDNMGRIGVPVETDDGYEDYYLRGSEPFNPVVEMTFEKHERHHEYGNEWAKIEAQNYVLIEDDYDWDDEDDE